MTEKLKFDEIGYWSEIKLDIVKDYAQKYSEILTAQRNPPLYHVYIDAFAGAGIHIRKTTGDLVAGSPLNALNIDPPFREYYLIDIETTRTDHLKSLVGKRADVHIESGDCNTILLNKVFPNVLFEQYRRGLCLLDPYGLHLDWKIIQAAGQMKTIDMFLNFPVLDMNRKVLWRDPEKVSASDINRMDRFWGDDSWRERAYSSQPGLFGAQEQKEDTRKLVKIFQDRLKKVAGFTNVPKPTPVRNTSGLILYYLFFASQKPVANQIVNHIFRKYENRGLR